MGGLFTLDVSSYSTKMEMNVRKRELHMHDRAQKYNHCVVMLHLELTSRQAFRHILRLGWATLTRKTEQKNLGLLRGA